MDDIKSIKISKSDTKLFEKYEKLKIYIGGVISMENIYTCIIYAMKLYKNSSMEGITKKEIVIKIVKTLIDECSIDDTIKQIFDEKFIGYIIESTYTEFKKTFKHRRICCIPKCCK